MNELSDIEGGIGYLDTVSDSPNLETDLKSETFTYFVGLSGNLTPKLKGSLSAGFQERSFDAIQGSESNPYISANLTWTVDETSNFRLSASQGFNTSISNRSVDELDVRLTANRALSRDLRASAYIGYEHYDYIDREDKAPTAGISLTYKLVRWGSFAFECNYRNQSSTEDEFDYNRFLIGIRFNGTW